MTCQRKETKAVDTELMKIRRHIETYFQQHLEKYTV